MQRKFAHVISWPGALSNATYTYAFTAPSDCTLVHVSLSQSNATVASTVAIGDSTDADGYATTSAALFGASCTPVELDNGDFDGALVTGNFPRISDGDVVKITITGGAANQATDGVIVLTFVEG